ncbi:hypothetical protein [Halomonas campaniensis]|uniref:Uncharacterized protein n=1 Tax=Halomonas campaniensis TaxID=213554 RepID=A0A2D0AYC7_9GAMM|nr:hypothetical protein [Halomonas campaniensis]OWV28034.1 hypothetical protein JI62_20275 [Halomonas campaniensis]
MSDHVLITLAKRKPYEVVPNMPEGCSYDYDRGLWTKSNEVLVSHSSEFGVQVTKKCDVETGEDQKGE